jgi:hypothetical protein
LQNISFGTAAILDQRFIGLLAGYKKAKYGIELFGGVTHRYMMKNAVNCLWMSYLSHTNGWKTADDSMKNAAAGIILSFRPIPHYRLQLLYLISMPNVDELRSHAWSLYFAGPIIRRYFSFRLETIAFLDAKYHFMPAVILRLNGRLGKCSLAPAASIGLAASFRGSEQHRINSIYENLSWGLIQRFNLFQGNIAFAQISWQALNLRKAKLQATLFAHYYAQSLAFTTDNFSDELNVGLQIRFRKLYDLKLAYVGVNLAPSVKSTHFAYAELRIIFGQ